MRQSHINFRNRVDELDLFMQQSNRVSIGKPRILMFSATDSFGATAFLQEAYHSSLSVSFNVFLDCSERSLDGFLRETIFSLENQEPELAELLQAGLHKLDAPSTEKKLL